MLADWKVNQNSWGNKCSFNEKTHRNSYGGILLASDF
jgi:hypothetical protein